MLCLFPGSIKTNNDVDEQERHGERVNRNAFLILIKIYNILIKNNVNNYLFKG